MLFAAIVAVFGVRTGAVLADPSAAARLNELGPESKILQQDVGTWEVVMTLQPTADAKPVVTKTLIAERVLVGSYLQETMRPAPGSKEPAFTRIDYLTFDRVAGRWQYVSMDTRLPVGIMPAASFGKGADAKVAMEFVPLGFVGMGETVEGTMMRSDMVIVRDGKNHQTKEQHWIKADGTGREWLAVKYDYRRKN